jgi:methionyl-tRNA formyltransferase
VYQLADGWDAGFIAAQDWCFVGKGENARELWERALAPMGLQLLAKVVQSARLNGVIPAVAQDPRFATKAPMIRSSVALKEAVASEAISLVVSIMGPDRPGIVSLLADRAQHFSANWAASRMTRLAGQFAGMVHFEVPRQNADALTTALRGLESNGLQVVIARSDSATPPTSHHLVELKLIGEDRVGILSRLTKMLAERSISIANIHTEIIRSGTSDKQTFKVEADLLVPASLSVDVLGEELGSLASEMMVDISMGERQGSTT